MEDPRIHFEQSYAYYRRLIEQYPQSTWTDNARYDMLYFVDYQPCCTDDLTPPGNIRQAYQLFGQFLKDYPDSDRRPDVLLRMAKIIQSGIEDENEQPVSKDSVATYLQIIAREYPDFASTSDDYRQLASAYQPGAGARLRGTLGPFSAPARHHAPGRSIGYRTTRRFVPGNLSDGAHGIERKLQTQSLRTRGRTHLYSFPGIPASGVVLVVFVRCRSGESLRSDKECVQIHFLSRKK